MAIKTIKIRIKDSNSKKKLRKMADSVNIVWNYCNETSYGAIRKYNHYLSAYDLAYLTAGTSWELGIHSETIRDVCEAYASKRIQNKKIKMRWRGRKSLGWIPFDGHCIKFDADPSVAYYYGLKLKVFQPERLQIARNVKCGQITEDSLGNWYLCLVIENDQEQYNGAGEVGIDLGIKNLAALSTGQLIENPRFRHQMRYKISRAQRHKKKRQLKKIHTKIKNRRMDFLQKRSTEIVKQNCFIAIGNYNAVKMVKIYKGTRVGKIKFAKAAYDVGSGMFKYMVQYKASAQLNCHFVEVREDFSTQICSSCKIIPASSPKRLKGLGIREWVCSECGVTHDRDINAAINILRFGQKSLETEVIQESTARKAEKLTSPHNLPKRKKNKKKDYLASGKEFRKAMSKRKRDKERAKRDQLKESQRSPHLKREKKVSKLLVDFYANRKDEIKVSLFREKKKKPEVAPDEIVFKKIRKKNVKKVEPLQQKDEKAKKKKKTKLPPPPKIATKRQKQQFIDEIRFIFNGDVNIHDLKQFQELLLKKQEGSLKDTATSPTP